jgi:hypothetical protein
VVGFSGTYHAILGRPAYAKFMAVPNYTYLILKILSPKGIIAVRPTYQRTYECDTECFQFVEAIVRSERLRTEPRSEDQDVLELSKRAAFSFEPAKDVKDAVISDADRTLRIGTVLDPKAESTLVDFLKANLDVFAWKPSDMKGILREVAEHKLNIKSGSKLVKQRLRYFNDEKCKAIGEVVMKLLSAGFVQEVFHPVWLANLVLVTKKNKKWRMCVDFTSLNKACPKDPFSLPRIDQVVDSTAGCETLCFLNAYSGYHQIAMCIADQLATSFITPFSAYCYQTMPFGLKNTGATFQSCMRRLFRELIG